MLLLNFWSRKGTIMKLCIFEDNFYRRLLPLVWMRPVYFLRCGITNLAEKISAAYPGLDVVYHCRNYLTEATKEVSTAVVNSFTDDSYLVMNGRIIFGREIAAQISLEEADRLYCTDDAAVAAILSPGRVETLRNCAGEPLELRKMFPGLPVTQVESNMIRYPWDIVNANLAMLPEDFSRLCPEPEIQGNVYEGVYIVNRETVHVGAETVVKPGVVLDAEHGPIYIDTGVTIMANTVIEGPAYIGRGSLVKAGTKIYGGTTIGEACKVGGEITASIIHSHTNKQHDGFLGHSYLCQWINIGADTNNSNLKNNYNNVTVTIDGEETDTGTMFVGLLMGDHSKTGINTMFNTGSVVGVHCNIFGGGFPPKYMPSFSWGGSDGFAEYKFDKAVETVQHVVSRKKMKLSVAFERLFSYIFDQTVKERAKFIP